MASSLIPPPDRASKPVGFLHLLLRNLLAGARAAVLTPIAWDLLAVSWLQMSALLLLSVLPSLLAQLLSVGFAGEFSSYGLPGIFFPFTVIFILAAVSEKLLDIGSKAAALILVLVSASIVIDAVLYAVPFLVTRWSAASYLIVEYAYDIRGVWLGVVFAVLLVRLGLASNARKWLVAAPTGLVAALVLSSIWQDRTLWSEPYSDEIAQQHMDNYYAAASEEVFYLQPKLLAEQLNRLQPGLPGAASLYFLGVAGYAEQGVFMREIRSISDIMQSRFVSAERSVILVNNKETLKTDPIATVTSIREAIAKIGNIMDRENDILFVYLTSHGSKEHQLSLQLHPLQLKDLEPADLRKALDDANIQWRVIVVSACYSGGFVEPLANDRTLVITAAAADKTSFGCSDENDYTYFGRAYFEEALAETNSFVEAFQLAKDNVTKRELAEAQVPSNPQISVGREIQEKLNEFQQRIPLTRASN